MWEVCNGSIFKVFRKEVSMNLDDYKLLKTKEIVAVLDGDEDFGDFNSRQKMSMPYLSGSAICDVGKRFGLALEYEGMKSRWSYMYDLIDLGIGSSNISDVLSYLFDESNFSKNIPSSLTNEEFKEYYKRSVESAIGRINSLLHYSGKKLVIKNNKAVLVSRNKEEIELSVKNITTINRDYIKRVAENAIDNIERSNYDSALTQARTILEETFCFVLEQRNIQANNKGNIKNLYKEVKNEYRMHIDEKADRRVKMLLSGLENIVSAVAEMRNKSSDAHGVGENRLTIDKHHARLAVNSAMTMADFILSVEKKANGKLDY